MSQETESNTAAVITAQDNVTGPRIGAAIIDIIILGVVFFVFGALFGDSSASSGDDGASFNVGLTGGAAILYFLVVLGYYLVLEGTRGQTLGKMALSLKVVSAEGGELTFGAVAIRTILRIVDGLPTFYLLGIIVVAVSQKNQRLGDMAAKTLVVRAK